MATYTYSLAHTHRIAGTCAGGFLNATVAEYLPAAIFLTIRHFSGTGYIPIEARYGQNTEIYHASG